MPFLEQRERIKIIYTILSTELNVAGDKDGGVKIVPLQRLYMRVLSADIAGC
jgi:hypothetical protein